ncbi:MAG: 6,7-dimethyl-8-ribityllumazine synthase [Phycisphaerales bacterium]|nr:6,7-dimethyl-8-ribityllumazine synthase [Phycisphaerales bacterium]
MTELTHNPAAPLPTLAVVVSRYNASITDCLLEGARAAYEQTGGDPLSLHIIGAPGAFELTALSAAAARTGRFAGVVALGCLIKGETRHDRYIASAVAHGLTEVTIRTGVPVAFGLITANTPKQARERAGGVKGNKGSEAMVAVLNTIAAITDLGPVLSSSARIIPVSRPLPDKARAAAARGTA